MSDRSKLLFYGLCLPVRFLLAYIAYKSSPDLLRYYSLPALVISYGFFTIYFFDLRKTGPETFGKPIWWNEFRPMHGALYLAFSYAAYKKDKYAYIYLLLDAILGLVASILHNMSEKNQKEN